MSLSKIKSIITFRQEAEPASKVEGDVWLNPRTEVVQTWNGSSWDLNWKGYGLYGYSMGGIAGSTLSMVERFNFPFDSGSANKVGEVADLCNGSSACNSTQYAYFGGNNSNPHKIYRFEFPFDFGKVNQIGNLNSSTFQTSSCNSSNHGFFSGGSGGSYTYHSNIERITFPFNSGTGSIVGNLSASKRDSGSVNSSTQGYIIAGTNSPATDYLGTTTIDRITFPFNSGTSAVVGYVIQQRSSVGAFNSSTHGYVAAGWFRSGVLVSYFSFIEKISFPWNVGVATFTGYASFEGYKECTCNSSRFGYMMGGWNGTIQLSTIDRVAFPFNSGYSSSVGTLTGSRYLNIGIDECDFVNQFV